MKIEEHGSFYVDQHIGTESSFNVYTMGPTSENGYVKSIKLKDNRGNTYSNMVERLQFHYLNVFNVPFDTERVSFCSRDYFTDIFWLSKWPFSLSKIVGRACNVQHLLIYC